VQAASDLLEIVAVRRPSLLFAIWLAGCGVSGGAPGSAEEAGVPSDASTDDASRTPDASMHDAATHDGGHHDAAPGIDASPTIPDAGAIPWETGAQIGYGVAFKDTKNPTGDNVYIGYAGYQVTLGSAEAWVEALYGASLAARGVRYLWAVQGPNDPQYVNAEIGNSKIVAKMVPLVDSQTKFILAAGHSSGSFVAHELLGQLAGGLDPKGVTAGRVVYFDLDGGGTGLTTQSVDRLRNAYFVGSHDGKTNTDSPNLGDMQSLGATYASAGGYWQNDASGSGCNAGAQWCVHVTLITTRPHDPTNASPQLDYSDFAGRPVCHTWIDAKSTEAGLVP
jgi:hypothetical protein